MEIGWPLCGRKRRYDVEWRIAGSDPEETFTISELQRQVSERSSHTELQMTECSPTFAAVE